MHRGERRPLADVDVNVNEATILPCAQVRSGTALFSGNSEKGANDHG